MYVDEWRSIPSSRTNDSKPYFCTFRWEHLETLREEKGSELIDIADVKTFLKDCQDTQLLIQDGLTQLDKLGHGNMPAVLRAERLRLSALEKDISVQERKIEYLKNVAKS